MVRLWILVLTLTLLTGSAYGSLTFWMSMLGIPPAPIVPPPPPPPPPPSLPIIIGGPGFGNNGGYSGGNNGGGGCIPTPCGGG